MADSEASNEATSSDKAFEQAPVTDYLIWSICDDVGADWKDLGIVLGLEEAFLDNVETDLKECREKARRVLRKWRRKNGKEATVGMLINALEKIERRDIVDNLRESRICSRCPGLEKELSEIKTEKEALENKIIQLELKQDEDKKTRNEEEKRLKEENIQLEFKRDALIKSNHEQLKMIGKLKQKLGTQKEEVEKLGEQIKILKAENEKLMMLKTNQPDPEELSQLRKEKTELSTKIEELSERVNESELDYKRLQEKLDKYINYKRHVFSPTSTQFGDSCKGVICFLKRESAKLLAYRSSDGVGSANDIFDHRRGTISGTGEIKSSWWSIFLGPCYQLVITNCSLRDGKKNGDSALMNWRLEGSNDGKNWEIFETVINIKDPRCKCEDKSLYHSRLWSLRGEIKPFRFFRIFQTGVNSSGKYGIYLSGVELYGILLKAES